MHKKIYYGWWIVIGAIVCQFASISVGQSVVGIFMQPVIDELGWSVWQFTLGPSLAVGIGSLSGLFAGPILDRRGPRILILTGAFVTALCFYGLGRQSYLWLYWGLHLIAGLIGWNLFGPLVINATLNKWFIQKRGWALAIGSIGISLTGLITPLTMTTLVDSLGWRSGYSLLALCVLVVIVPIAFMMRRTPEDMGLQPDGVESSAPDDSVTKIQVRDERAYTSSAAIRTQGFWLLVLGFGFNQAALSSVLVHAIPFATDAAFSRTVAALALTVNGLGNLLSKAVWGYTLQRIEVKRLVLVAFSVAALGVGLMLVATLRGQIAILFLGFFCYGFGFGGTIPLSEFLWAKYFGRRHIGAIRGISQPLTVVGPTLGPILVGLWYDYAQSYQPAFLTIIGVYLAGALLIWVSREPGYRE